ncbi:MAG: putative Zn-dependent hydrolase [Bacteroidetes bacterium HLUCCA01]|nr:MAG: putative Zn-dependent hydrolase [Bacteroidetes bacterium HLUCCA01]
MKSNLIWLGHSAFQLTTPEDKVIYIDPFLSGNPKTPEAFKKVTRADYILLTHGHEDHVGDTLDIARETGCKVVGIVELIALLKKAGLAEDQAVEFNKGGTVNFEGFSVTLVSANHSSSYGLAYAGEAGGLIVRVEDDVTFYHMGDTNIFADLEFYGQMYKPDLVAVPIGDHYTMGDFEGALCCELIGAPYAIPIHYGTFPVLTGSPELFQAHAAESSDTQVLIPKPGERIVLPEES